MNYSFIDRIIEKQRGFFDNSIENRLDTLRRIYSVVKENESDILEALEADLGKNRAEGFVSEIGFVLHEISYVIKKLKCWAKPQRVATPLLHFPAKSKIYHEPYGVCLIIAPWNYPFQLMFSPLIGAIAGGNTAVLKPSEISPQTSKIIAGIIGNNFDEAQIAVIEGGIDVSRELLERKWDKIFFTGSVNVGRIVMRKAAENLTPITLELGGKSPAIVEPDIDLSIAAKRIAFGKWINAGQTCIAPDYVLVHRSIAEEFLEELVVQVEGMYGKDSKFSEAYGLIVDKKRWDRLDRLLGDSQVYYGGKRDGLHFDPTIIKNIDIEHPLMGEEIFGPVLPVIEYDTLDEAISLVQQNPDPLALYFFSRSKTSFERVRSALRFGGACINDTIVHIVSFTLPFGGVGTSGMGRYHGRASFDAFTYKKSVMKRRFAFDLSFRYPPYSGFAERIIRYLFK